MDPLDVAVRHQAYIEGVKNYEADAMEPTAEALAALLVALLLKWGYVKLSDMPKRVLRDFTAAFNLKADKLLSTFNDDFVKELKTITKTDALVTSLIFAALTGKPAHSPGSADTWAKITNEPIPASGHMPLALLKDFVRSTKHQIGLLIRRAYAEKWTVAQIMTAVNGTRARKFKDGLLHKVQNQFNTVQQTLIQHIHSWLVFNFGRVFYTHYQWVSVLDGNTTDICISRAGKIYAYATGPRPPAHYNCRSTIVAIAVEQPRIVPNRFYDWLKAQPTEVQNDMLGVTRAQQLRAGTIGAKELPKFDGTRKITPKEFGTKQPLIMA